MIPKDADSKNDRQLNQQDSGVEASFRSDGKLIDDTMNMSYGAVDKIETHESKQEDLEHMRNLGEFQDADIGDDGVF